MFGLHELVDSSIRISIGIFIILSGVAKLRLPKGQFARAVLAYDILPLLLAQAVSVVLPSLEVILGCLLIIGYWQNIASVVTAGLLMTFAFAVSINLWREKQNDCGCGLRSQPIHWGIPLRNLLLSTALLLTILT